MFKRLAYVATMGGLCFAMLLGSGNAKAQQTNADIIPGQYIVMFDDSVSEPGPLAQRMASRFGTEPEHVYSHALKGFSAQLSDAAVARLQSLPEVVSIMPDQRVSITAQSLPTGINRVEADLSPTARIDGVDQRVNVDVAILDTGIDLDHPDLNVRGGVSCVGGSADDRNGHGTHVAGTVGALDNSFGVVGVAPGARLWAVKVLRDNGSGSFSSIICGVDWVTARAGTIEVANMSLGGGGSDPSGSGCSTGNGMHDAICRSVGAGVTYVVAAGNSARDARSFVPAAFDEVITVSALADFNGRSGGGARPTCRSDVDDTFANFSNYGRDIDLIAPGVCILSTFPGGRYNGNYSGTSMAAPHVAGGAALYKARNPGASPAAVKSALQSAGTLDWNNSDDGDNIKERLLNVRSF